MINIGDRVRIVKYDTKPEEFVGIIGNVIDIDGAMVHVMPEDWNDQQFPLLMYDFELEVLPPRPFYGVFDEV